MPLGGIINSVMNPVSLVQIAMGPAGWASLAMRTIGAQIGMNIIQQLGQALGLPQPMIDMAQGAFASAAGMPGLARQNLTEAATGLADQFGFNPRQTSEMSETANDALNNFVSTLSESEEMKEAKAGGGREAGGWLMALASVMGEKLNDKAEQVRDLAGEITDKTPDKTAKFGAASQEFGIMMNATNTAIKSIGEGLSSMARKQ